MDTTAKVPDILRSVQQDDSFINETQNNIQQILKLLSSKNQTNARRFVPGITRFWYYFMTSCSNLQTLGEEYTGSIRVNSDNKIPSKLLQLIWLTLFATGESLCDVSVKFLQKKSNDSKSLTPEAQTLFLNILKFCQYHRDDIKRLHKSLFYINGKYFRISNRLTGIKYILVRPWMEDNTFTTSFVLLGYSTLFYTAFSFMQKIWLEKNSQYVGESNTLGISRKFCVLCGENLRNICVTPCGHIFCWDCIHNSLLYQKNCPACREEVEPNRVIFLQNYA